MVGGRVPDNGPRTTVHGPLTRNAEAGRSCSISNVSTFRAVAQPILIAVVLAVAARSTFRIYSIPSTSMEPTLSVGDHILVTPYHGGSPARGDVVVFRSPANRDELFVKRVVAGPGDLIESRAGRLFVGGHAVAEPYLFFPATTGAIASQIVPPGFYFVLGDNRANSFDSRQWGYLSQRALVGRARLVLWSSGSGSMEPRAHATSVMDNSRRAPTLHLHRLFKTIE